MLLAKRAGAEPSHAIDVFFCVVTDLWGREIEGKGIEISTDEQAVSPCGQKCSLLRRSSQVGLSRSVLMSAGEA